MRREGVLWVCAGIRPAVRAMASRPAWGVLQPRAGDGVLAAGDAATGAGEDGRGGRLGVLGVSCASVTLAPRLAEASAAQWPSAAKPTLTREPPCCGRELHAEVCTSLSLTRNSTEQGESCSASFR